MNQPPWPLVPALAGTGTGRTESVSGGQLSSSGEARGHAMAARAREPWASSMGPWYHACRTTVESHAPASCAAHCMAMACGIVRFEFRRV